MPPLPSNFKRKDKPVKPVNLGEEAPDIPDPTSLVGKVQQWQWHKNEARKAREKEEALKAEIKSVVQKDGQPDKDGHVWFELPVATIAFDTKGKPQTVNAVQCQRRVSVMMDEDKALEILEAENLVDAAADSWIRFKGNPDELIALLIEMGFLLPDEDVEVKTEPREDAVRGLYYEKKITEEQYHEIFPEKITWALLPGSV